MKTITKLRPESPICSFFFYWQCKSNAMSEYRYYSYFNRGKLILVGYVILHYPWSSLMGYLYCFG